MSIESQYVTYDSMVIGMHISSVAIYKKFIVEMCTTLTWGKGRGEGEFTNPPPHAGNINKNDPLKIRKVIGEPPVGKGEHHLERRTPNGKMCACVVTKIVVYL